VVFTPAGHNASGRRGVIVCFDEEGARQEARRIAHAGGRAEVHYLDDDGPRVVARYPDDDLDAHQRCGSA
jgi:hypothetical protein